MKKDNKWKMNRAGLLNFWYYDNEIFEFSDGKLLLRGGNGSGKSVTMQSILPVLLDGKKSPDRLDPFGSKARKMEDYLLGEKDIVDRDERTGYLFLEYKREDTNQYITTGIGLQARRNKTMNTWYFVITDNRRIGESVQLYETEHNNGEKQQIPLSRIQLENRIGTGGYVVRTQGDYMRLVNKYIFGFEEIEAYEDLIKLLIQLRSPKLSKDFKPTVIYEILEAALPPLTDEDLRHLSDTIEHMDQTKQQMEQLEREQQALNKIINRYDLYNEFSMADKAREYLKVKRRLAKSEKVVKEKVTEDDVLAEEINGLTMRNQELEQSIDVLEQKQKRLQSHKVWNLEEERMAEQQKLEDLTTDLAKKDDQLTEKKRQEIKTKEKIAHFDEKIVLTENEIADLLLDMETDAETVSFDKHSLNEQDFERNRQNDFDFSVWSQEAENHYQTLDTISEQLRTYEDLKEKMVATQKKVADTQLQQDKLRLEEKDWMRIFEKDKQEKLDEMYSWAEQFSFFSIEKELLQQVSRMMDQLYDAYTFEMIRTPFLNVNRDYQMEINKTIATKESKITTLEINREEKEMELQNWKKKRDPEPPNQQVETKEAREKLEEKGVKFIPFYEAVEFQEHVPDHVRKQMEAALLDAGVLDALIVESDIPIQHDRIIETRPNMMAHTLADYLMPDLEEKTTVSSVKVDEVLRSILVDDRQNESGLSIQDDGTYRVGIMHGHAVPVEDVRFIGRNARKRYREEQIASIMDEISQLQQEIRQVNGEIDGLEASIQAANDAMERFPNDDDLQVSSQQMKEKQFEIKQLTKQLQLFDNDLQQINHEYQTVKRTLDQNTRHLNITFTYKAYLEAKNGMRIYDKALRELITMHKTYLHYQENWQTAQMRLEELMIEVDDIQGELNILQSNKSRTEKNIVEIVKQLEQQGVSDIRKQIQHVQSQLKENNDEWFANKNTLPHKEAKRQTLREEIVQHKQKVLFLTNLLEAWYEAFSQDVNYGFVSLPKEIESNEKLAVWVDNTFGYLLKEKESTQIEGQLTSAFFEQHANLMEYRMTDTKVPALEFPWMKEEWSEEEHIQINNWKQKATRRLIQLDFQGKRVSPYYIQEQLEQDLLRQQHLLDDQDRKLYEEILFDSVGKKLRSRIGRAQTWTEKMDKLMSESDSSSGLSFSIRWKPRTAETEAELDTKELVELLRMDPRLLKDEDISKVIDHFRSKIDRAKELVDIQGEGNTLLQVLKGVLDYRHWFSFVLSYKREGEGKRELTNHAFFQFSGGEKAMAMYIPLFTACYSRYSEADRTAPYIISLDEAFAGVDEDNISVMFRIVEELGFDYMMNSQVLWGDYETISSLSICELVRPKNQDFVTVIRYHWDGKKRNLIVNEKHTRLEEIK